MSGVSNYEPYAPNSQGLTEALIDLKSTMANKTVYSVAGFQAIAFENVAQGDALYSRTSDGKVGRAIASLNEEEATVVGFAQTSKFAGQTVRVLIVGVLGTSGLSPGELYYLSSVSAGGISTTPPITAGQYVTRVGEAASSAELIVQLEPPIKLATTFVPGVGQAAFTSPGSYTWTAPADVNSVSVVCVGGGGGGGNWTSGVQGGSGGGLGWKNNISVIPGQTYTVVVGAGGSAGGSGLNGGNGGNSYFDNLSTVAGLGGLGGAQYIPISSGGGYVGDGGGSGGGARGVLTPGSGGGGGAGGYTGSGGIGARAISYSDPSVQATAGSGGGGGGGASGDTPSNNGAGGGGGVGIFGQGANGAAGPVTSIYIGVGGGGGSGGTNGQTGQATSVGGINAGGAGGSFGGGGGNSQFSGIGGGGAVRIIWPGNLRQFPSTRTADE